MLSSWKRLKCAFELGKRFLYDHNIRQSINLLSSGGACGKAVPMMETCILSAGMRLHQHQLWPDWAIFEKSWWQMFFKSSQNLRWPFGPQLNVSYLRENYRGNFWINLGYFLFQYLVTLINIGNPITTTRVRVFKKN